MLSPLASGQVVISQVYGGAGATGATFNQDFVELFNRGPIAVDLSTWSLQYASATGNSWGKTNLVGSIPSGGYYLVTMGSGTGTSPVMRPAPPRWPRRPASSLWSPTRRC
jgi:predicted extracellular nuclease